MSVLPVIVRELRTQARQPLTHWLRVIGAVSIAGAVVAALWTLGRLRSDLGPTALPSAMQAFGSMLFGKMNLFIFLVIWMFVPLATADAVSRERREGTLALLYLTELGAWGIVAGKGFVHMLRSVSLFLTMAPWLMLPLLFGGVSLKDIGMALMLNFASVLLAQAAGLLASTIPRDWLKSVILAELFALMLALTLLHVHGEILRKAVRAGTPSTLTPGTTAFWGSTFMVFGEFYDMGMTQAPMISRFERLLELTTNESGRNVERWYGGGMGRRSAETDWQQIWTILTPAGPRYWFLGVTGLVIGAALILLTALGIGAWQVERSWQDAPPQAMVSELRREFFSPRFGVRSLNRKLSRSLTANPIGWLQQYSPSARMVKWGWCSFIILVEIFFSSSPSDLYRAQAGVGLFLLLGLTFSATGSFRGELETGAFELLLVTPLRELQIITGRVRGLWRQFLPAILVYGTGSIYLASGWKDQTHATEAWLALGRTMTGFCALPLIGLYFSVQRWNFFAAWLAACLIGLLPAWLGRAFGAKDWWIVGLQLSVALAAGALLQRRLANREFLQKQV